MDEVLSRLKAEVETAPTVEVKRNRNGYSLLRVDGEQYDDDLQKVFGVIHGRVTGLLGGIPKDWLGFWAAKIVAEYAVAHQDAWKQLPRTDAIKLLKGAPWTKRDDAGARGSAVHNALEAHLLGKEIPELSDDAASCAESAGAFLSERNSKILGTEITVFNHSLNYAGTLDVWELRDGRFGILDWKTSKNIGATMAVQLIAYQHAEFALVKKTKIGKEHWSGKLIPWKDKAQDLGIVHVTPKQSILYPIVSDDIGSSYTQGGKPTTVTQRLWNVFLCSAYIKKWLSDIDDFAGKKPAEKVFEELTNGETKNESNK
jgi:hypothetical protein